jgi:hypothetical protein
MKFRKGFVSNSSSTNFIIIVRNKLGREDIFEKITHYFFEDSRASFSAVTLCDPYHRIAEQYIYESDPKEYTNSKQLDEYIGAEYYEGEKWFELLRRAANEGNVLIKGSMPDSGDGGNYLQQFLRRAKVHIDFDEDFFMWQDDDDEDNWEEPLERWLNYQFGEVENGDSKSE